MIWTNRVGFKENEKKKKERKERKGAAKRSSNVVFDRQQHYIWTSCLADGHEKRKLAYSGNDSRKKYSGIFVCINFFDDVIQTKFLIQIINQNRAFSSIFYRLMEMKQVWIVNNELIAVTNSRMLSTFVFV